MKGHEYRDLIAAYVLRNYGAAGLDVYTEVSLGKTIIGKDRKLDVFLVHRNTQAALAIECKYQESQGTTDEKIPYAIKDLQAVRVPGCLAYAGQGWSTGILHTLEASPLAAYCLPDGETLEPGTSTRQLDHVVAATFGFWAQVIPRRRLFEAQPSEDG